MTLGEGYDKIELFKIEIFKIGGYAMKKENRSAEKGNKAALNAEKADLNEDKTGVATENSIEKTDKAVSETEKETERAGITVNKAVGKTKSSKNTKIDAENADGNTKKARGAVAEIKIMRERRRRMPAVPKKTAARSKMSRKRQTERVPKRKGRG